MLKKKLTIFCKKNLNNAEKPMNLSLKTFAANIVKSNLNSNKLKKKK